MVGSRERQDSWLKAEEAKNAAKKSRNQRNRKVDKGLTDVRNFWKQKESDLAGSDPVVKVTKDVVVTDRKRKTMEDAGLNSALVEGRKRTCVEAADTTEMKNESEKDEKKIKFKKLILNNYPTSSSDMTGGGGGDHVGVRAELVQHFLRGRGPAQRGKIEMSASQCSLRVSGCAAASGKNKTGQ